MTAQTAVQEGTVPFRGYDVWYRIVGEGEQPGKHPLLALHGGPGVPHDYLEPLEQLAATGRRVIFYDQVGCGNSGRPRDPALYTVAFYVEELGAVRRALGLERVHLLGQSWGGMLAMEYALTRPEGIASLILANSLASAPQWASEMSRLLAELPAEVQATLRQHEAAGTTDDPAYVAAMLVFYARHVCRLDPWPDYMTRTFVKFQADSDVYNAMWGVSEFSPTGTLRDWDITDRLGEIRLPTLLISGRYDEATPAIVETLHRGIAGSEWLLLEESSHMAHAEETEEYMGAVAAFLERVEAG